MKQRAFSISTDVNPYKKAGAGFPGTLLKERNDMAVTG